jgi:HAD superfamily hydrolase (TIGR01484 family)
MTRNVPFQSKPLCWLDAAVAGKIEVLLTDIDDTLTTKGRVSALAYDAMARAQAAGLKVIPVTGRPAGWCDLIARQWPVAAVVGENGAFYFRYDDDRRRMRRVYAKPAAARDADRRRLDALASRILEGVDGAAIAADQAFRIADLAIDYAEDVGPLPPEAVRQIVILCEDAGATAKVSSIHVNAWFGRYDKLGMSLRLLTEGLGLGADSVTEKVTFIGDSPNDAPMFAYFPHAIGVANVMAFMDHMTRGPCYITTMSHGAGFAEAVNHLTAARETQR